MRMICMISLLFLGCSSENSDPTGGQSNEESSVSRPENWEDIETLYKTYDENKDEYKRLIGKTVSIEGEFLSYDQKDEDRFIITVKKLGEVYVIAEIYCEFPSDDIISKCLPGQTLQIEGELGDEEFSVFPRLKNAKLVAVSGETDAAELDVADLKAGKTYPKYESHGILNLKIKSVTPGGEYDSSLFVDLDTETPMCVQFSTYKSPHVKRYKALKPGDTLRVLGSRTYPSLRKDSKQILGACLILDEQNND